MSSGQPGFGLSQPHLSSMLLHSYTHFFEMLSLSSPCRTRSLLVTGGKLGSLASQSGSLQPMCALALPSQPRPGAQVLWGSISRAVFLTPPFPPCSAGLSPSSVPTVTFLASGGLPLCVQAEPPDLALKPRSGLSGDFCSIAAL